jgi:plastocyanin
VKTGGTTTEPERVGRVDPGRQAGPRTHSRRAAVIVGLVGVVALSAGCLGHTGGGGVPPGATLVQIYHMAFRPRIVTVTAGQTVTWRFEDAQVVHNVDSPTGGFKSPDRDSGTWSHTFSTPGTYSYFCSIHTYMTGAVVVLPAHSTTSGT